MHELRVLAALAEDEGGIECAGSAAGVVRIHVGTVSHLGECGHPLKGAVASVERFGPNARPIERDLASPRCFDSKPHEPASGTEAIASGWGTNSGR